jgi:hypothetical protein
MKTIINEWETIEPLKPTLELRTEGNKAIEHYFTPLSQPEIRAIHDQPTPVYVSQKNHIFDQAAYLPKNKPDHCYLIHAEDYIHGVHKPYQIAFETIPAKDSQWALGAMTIHEEKMTKASDKWKCSRFIVLICYTVIFY